jgi:hypothetical protein
VPSSDHCRREPHPEIFALPPDSRANTLPPRKTFEVAQPLASCNPSSRSLWLFGRFTMISLTSFSKIQTLPSDRCSSWQGTPALHIPLLQLESSFISTLLKLDYIAAERCGGGSLWSRQIRGNREPDTFIFQLSCPMCRAATRPKLISYQQRFGGWISLVDGLTVMKQPLTQGITILT